MEPQVGQLINNKYRLVRLIGDGGMGSVYEARHELLGTTVALKFLHAMLSRRKGLVERFLQEAQVSARIRSVHVANVSDVDRTPEGLAYMVMEYVEGDTLQTTYEKNYREGRRLTETEAFDIMLQMMEGVSAAHGQGIVHRDLKPDNVILSRDDKGQTLVKILDFGIAKLKASGEMDRGLTRPGVVMGTPEYMAPEQAFSADRVDVRADVFSMGVMFFEMLAGRRPVGGDNAHAIAAQYLEGRVARLDELAPHLAGPLCDAVHQAMSAEPEQRFLSVAAFRTAIADHAPSDLEASLSDTAEGSDGALAAAAAGITAGDEKGRGPRGPGDEHDDDAAAAPATAGMGVAEAPPLAVDPHAGGLDDTAAALSGDDGEPPAVNPTGTVAMDHLVPAPAAHPGTDPMGTPGEDQVTPPAGGTVVGEGFVPPPFEPSGAPSPFEGPAGGLGAVPATSSLGVTPPPGGGPGAPPPRGGAPPGPPRGGGPPRREEKIRPGGGGAP
ncbi:MAG: protein kinase, partial [Myxococcota bacterium]